MSCSMLVCAKMRLENVLVSKNFPGEAWGTRVPVREVATRLLSLPQTAAGASAPDVGTSMH